MSTERQTWKRKKRLSGQAERMRAAKRQKNAPTDDRDTEFVSADVESIDVNVEASSSAEGLTHTIDTAETTISSPGTEPVNTQEPLTSQSLEAAALLESDIEADETAEQLDPQTVFDDWMLTLTKPQRKMLAVLLYCSFQNRQKLSKMGAAQESASIAG